MSRDYYLKKYPSAEMKYFIPRIFELVERIENRPSPYFTRVIIWALQ